MKKILTDAAAVGQATGRALQWQALDKHPEWAIYEGSQWNLMLWEGVARGNWIQTDPEKGWFNILRLYSPLPAYFDKSWRPSEIELVD